MDVTTYLAMILGWYFVITGFLLLFRQNVLKLAMKDILAHRGTLFVIAFLNMLLGLILVLSHNIWSMGWPAFISVLCWLILVMGIFRLFFPEHAIKWGECWMKKSGYMTTSGIINLVLGLYLIYGIYF